MKKNYLLGLILFFPLLIIAQPYFNSGATWQYGMWPNDTSSYIKIEKTGEIWVGGKFCDELKFSGYDFNNNPTPFVYYHYTHYSGDTVYIYKSQNGTFGVLYDFTATVGDSVSCAFCVTYYIIDSVTYTTLSSVSLETQHFRVGTQTFRTFEKIGNTGYFIPWFDMLNPMSPGWQLKCYSDSSGLSYHDGSSDCSSPTSIPENESLQMNVFINTVTFQSQNIQPGSEICIYDLTGNIIAYTVATASGTCSIEMERAANSIYIAVITSGSKVISEKFLLAD